MEIIKPEFNYRAAKGLNYSLLKLWDENPAQFYKQYVEGITPERKPSYDTIVGDIAHFFSLDCRGDQEYFNQYMDSKFALYAGEKGSAQIFTLCDYAFEATMASVNRSGKPTIDEREAVRVALEKAQSEKLYKGKNLEYAFNEFNTKGYDYYTTLLNSMGKTVVTEQQISKGKAVASRVMSDEFTKHVFEGEIYTSFPIMWILHHAGQDVLCKSELDLFKVSHTEKRIYPYDLKCTWQAEDFRLTYLKFSYYIQQAFYHLALEYYFSEVVSGYEDYEIMPMQYIAADTSPNNRRPLIYQCTEKDLHFGLHGFRHKNRLYKGIFQMVEEVLWAQDNNIWDITRTAYNNAGRMHLNLNYESTIL